MKVLMAHNYYQQAGGEGLSFDAEVRLLRDHGHSVETYTVHNDDISTMGRLEIAARTHWNRTVARELESRMRAFKPEVVHFQNTFPLISPAAYHVAHRAGVPVVQSLRNYRLACPAATFFRDGAVCEDCRGRIVAWPSIAHACYRDSRAASAVVTSMLASHRMLGTWSARVHRYIALSRFQRDKLVGVIPAERVALKPNFVHPDPGSGLGDGNFVLFVGRLVAEKGLATLLRAWEQNPFQIPLRIVGDGPLAGMVSEVAARDPRIDYLGRRSSVETLDLVGEASILIVPSEWYEGFPRTIIEAYAKGTPVVASAIGTMAEVVDEETGDTFAVGNSQELGLKVTRLWNSPRLLEVLRRGARERYVDRYTGERNIARLIDIYAEAKVTMDSMP